MYTNNICISKQALGMYRKSEKIELSILFTCREHVDFIPRLTCLRQMMAVDQRDSLSINADFLFYFKAMHHFTIQSRESILKYTLFADGNIYVLTWSELMSLLFRNTSASQFTFVLCPVSLKLDVASISIP